MLSISQIENTLESLLEGPFADRGTFPEQEFLDAAAQSLGASEPADRARSDKETGLLLRSRNDFFISGDLVYSKQAFFQDAEFLVTPSDIELEKAILFPGAAFLPFCSDEVFSDEFELAGADGTQYPVIQTQCRFRDAAPAYLMLGASGVIDHLSAESESNRQAMKRSSDLDSAEFQLSAFDLSGFYRGQEFAHGDALVIRVTSWRDCRFAVRIRRKNEEPGEDAKREYVRDLENALLRVCETERDYLEIPQQIAEAYLFAFENGHDLRKRPVLSLEEYRHRMSEIGIRRDGGEWLLVPVDELDTPGQFDQSLMQARRQSDEALREHDSCACGHDHHEHAGADKRLHHENGKALSVDADLTPDQFSISGGALDSIDAILAELDAPVNSVELGAMIFDALANGEENFEDFRAHIMDFLELKFADDAQETAFLNFLEDNWEMSGEMFNPHQDMNRAPLRARLLELTNARIELSRLLLERAKGKALPEAAAETLKRLHQDILDTLGILNADNEVTDDQFEQLELRVGDIEDAWDDFTEKVTPDNGD